ncbi:MAG: electron transport complex subunit RsxE [Methylotenera sp. 24-45-7]|jgi:electron transport complex protein RnfE|nr:MAG: electron transport complex subunit RsxE [Mehylophilales bacterium 35-46-6]OYY81905.1 MAG: electron transport complex subunit RsxE [Methylophilales bacterium 16-45-9]OYZ41925.1 MAG: electron transport complex subunit RsxE [Methylotenera sp. 24-45-7]OZA08868.1 MAG: electron transport complex subunit RsxE [Methylotenera sp. 17-45-7]OZA53574.1 MAG: electron transport complex subunit RsxE [Methylophilales bacterium 39-45-7]HQS37386.1 electron transport complex subunit E [Methylotenera sp.]
MNTYKEITLNGLWKQNPGVVQLLGLCPTLAVTTTAVNGLSLGLATALVMAAANGSVSPVRRFIPSEIRVPVFILVIAALVTVIDMSINAFAHPLHKVLGIFIPLIVVNCIVLARVESFAAKNAPVPSIVDGFMMGSGLALVLGLLGGMREIIGKGTLFSGLDLVFGVEAKQFVLTVIPDYQGFLLAVLPPGAFLGLGALIALRNWAEIRKTQKASTPDNHLKPALSH